MTRWDVYWGGYGPRIETHFCREWEGDEGCYGTNPNHGYTWEEARLQMARWHLAQANEWIRKPEPSE